METSAVNRAKYVLEKYQRTPSAKDALEIMVEAYDKLGMKDLADDARRVLALNEKEGTLATLPERKRSLLGRVWDFMGLDKN